MNLDNSKLISDIGELTALFTNAANLDALLQNIVTMVALYMKSDVCSVYLFDDDTQLLTLKASQGLKIEFLGKVRLKLGEGLAGIAFKEKRVVCEGDSAKNRGFHSIPGGRKEGYCSYLAVPLLHGQNRIGVMTLQSIEKNYFSKEDVDIFQGITSQLLTTIEMAKLLFSFDHPQSSFVPDPKPTRLKVVKVRVGSDGSALGNSVVLAPLSLGGFKVSPGRKPLTKDDFRRAVVATEKELNEMQKAVEVRRLDVVALVFSAQIMMLKDRAMLGAMEVLIGKGVSPQDAVRAVIGEYVERFDRMTNEYVREKRYDVIDVGRRILTNMAGQTDSRDQYAAKVVIVRELLPSDILKLSVQKVAGIVLLSGGVTSHVAVLARSLNIPLVIADEPRLLTVKDGTPVLIDGSIGNILIAPSDEIVRTFQRKAQDQVNVRRVQKGMNDETRTKDGSRVVLLANINLLADLASAKSFKAEGVGLYRTEFPFLLRGDFPSEEEQYAIYRCLIEDMKGREITFRTLDVGGDKMLSYFGDSRESNPFLGLRSIRFSLKNRDIFIHQIRAILRASCDSDAHIMFPMISSIEEFMAARDIVMECVRALKSERRPHQNKPKIGAMIEVPSILAVIDDLAPRVDFFSIGTNDLIQYLLAVDRTNEKVAEFYCPHHPAVLRGIKRVSDAALRNHLDISVCGDMANDPRYIPFFIGIGIRKFSMDAPYLPKIQQRISEIDVHKAVIFAAELLGKTTLSDTARLIDRSRTFF